MCTRRSHRGFTLLELVLVLGLVALATALAAASLTDGFGGSRLRASAQEIASQLRFTRTYAIATGQAQQFTIAPRLHRWSAPKGRAGGISRQVGVAFFGAREVQPSVEEGAVVFFPDGASTGGRIRLELDGAAWQVEVAWLTGEVKTGLVAVP